MAIITKDTVKKLVVSVKTAQYEKGSPEMKNLIFSIINRNDYVPVSLVPYVEKVFIGFYYDKSGFGYNGVKNEIHKRIETIMYTEKAQEKGICVADFLLHKQGKTDTYDSDNKVCYEEKSGCGNWLYSENPVFDEVVKEYRRKRTLIRWDYTFIVETKKEGKQVYHIFIETTFARLFDFLSDFEKGFATWFKENSKSGLTGLYCWEMQTIKTSKKKADYLATWDAWNKTH